MLSQRNNTGLLFRVAKRLKGNETGVTLVEALVALAVLGLIAVAFLSGLTTAAQATFIADERATAESLVRSEMEYVKSQDYVIAPWLYELPTTPPTWDPSHTLPAGYNGYTVNVTAELLDGHETDDGIQKITVTVKRGAKVILTIEDYKVDRLEGE